MARAVEEGLLGIPGKVIGMRPKHRRLTSLRGIEILRELPPRQLRALSRNLDEVTVPTGTVLIHQGQLNRHAYFIESGSVRIDVDGERVATVASGSIVGERTAIDHGLANATVTAVEPTTVHIADHRVLLGTADAHPDFAAVLHDLAVLRSNPAA